MAYIKTTWENEPSESTPINASNLNKMEEGIYTNSINIGDLADLETTNKSTIVEAINEVNEIKNGEIYSTDEIKTNKYWINGKLIYRKCYEFTPSGTSASINTGITNFEKAILFSALPVYNGGTYAGMQYTSTNDKANIYISPDGTRFESRTLGTDIPAWRIIVEYTKTTD